MGNSDWIKLGYEPDRIWNIFRSEFMIEADQFASEDELVNYVKDSMQNHSHFSRIGSDGLSQVIEKGLEWYNDYRKLNEPVMEETTDIDSISSDRRVKFAERKISRASPAVEVKGYGESDKEITVSTSESNMPSMDYKLSEGVVSPDTITDEIKYKIASINEHVDSKTSKSVGNRVSGVVKNFGSTVKNVVSGVVNKIKSIFKRKY